MGIESLVNRGLHRILMDFRVFKYKMLSANVFLEGKARHVQPVLYIGSGQIYIGRNVVIGCFPSPNYWNSYAHIEVRNPTSKIVIGDNVVINNGLSIISEGATITIGEKVLIGMNCQIYDSDFHTIDPTKRLTNENEKKDVYIDENVWIGNNVIVLKGSHIGANSVIAAGSIVVGDIPANVIAAGSPAKIIKKINVEN